MPRLDVEIATPDGHSDATLHIPEGGGPWPGVVVFPDGYGARETIRQMGDRVADMGYVALVPDIYYRAGDWPPFDPDTAFTDPPERDRLSGYMGTLTNDRIIADANAYTDFLLEPDHHRPPRRTGCVPPDLEESRAEEEHHAGIIWRAELPGRWPGPRRRGRSAGCGPGRRGGGGSAGPKLPRHYSSITGLPWTTSSPSSRLTVPIPATWPGSGAWSLATRCEARTTGSSRLAPRWCPKTGTMLARCHRC
jgi:hypothetical protein